jgi:hypothetical protein
MRATDGASKETSFPQLCKWNAFTIDTLGALWDDGHADGK